MSIFGRRILEIGVISILLVLVVSVSCAMGRACPSGFISSSGSNKLGSGGGSGNNMIGTDEKIKDIHQKVTQAKGNNNSDTLNTVTPTSTEGDMSTTNKPISVILYSANNHYGRLSNLAFSPRNKCQRFWLLAITCQKNTVKYSSFYFCRTRSGINLHKEGVSKSSRIDAKSSKFNKYTRGMCNFMRQSGLRWMVHKICTYNASSPSFS